MAGQSKHRALGARGINKMAASLVAKGEMCNSSWLNGSSLCMSCSCSSWLACYSSRLLGQLSFQQSMHSSMHVTSSRSSSEVLPCNVQSSQCRAEPSLKGWLLIICMLLCISSLKWSTLGFKFTAKQGTEIRPSAE